MRPHVVILRCAAIGLAGFAVRPKAEVASAYDCEYRGSFSSGRIIGPVSNGAPCRSEPGDRLEAIQLFILPKTPDIAAAAPRRLTADAAPLRNTETPWWMLAHAEVDLTGIAATAVKTLSNCGGCHQGVGQ